MHSRFLGRQFSYDQALQIMQDEDYLEDADFDDIKRKDKVDKYGHFKSDSSTQIKYSGWTPTKGSQTNLMDPHKVKRSGIVYKVYI